MVKLKLEDDGYCFVCGQKNTSGLKLKFILDKENTLRTEFHFNKNHQGYKDIVHGGIIALILDELMGNLCWRLRKNAVNAQIEVRFKQPLFVNSVLYFKSWIEKEDRKIIYLRAEAKNKEGVAVASASGKAVKLKEG